MLNKKKLMEMAMLVTLLTCACGCGKNKADGKGSHIVEVDMTGEDSNEMNADLFGQMNQTGATKLLCQNHQFSNMATTDQGMYRLAYAEFADGTFGERMYYIDYASAQEIVLCNDASCTHDTTNCMGVFDDPELIGASLFIYDNKLYAFRSNDKSGFMSMQTEIAVGGENDMEDVAVLYQMNLDGTDRRKLDVFAEDVSIDQMVLEWNGQLVFLEKQIETNKTDEGFVQYTGVNRTLISVNPSSGKATKLQEFPEDYFVAGVYGDKLVCYKQIYPNGYTQQQMNELDFGEWKQLMMQSKSEYFLFDIASGEEMASCTMNYDEYMDTGIVLGDKLYFANGSSKVTCVELETGAMSDITMPNDFCVRFVDIIGNRIYCWPEDNAEEAYFFDPVTNDLVKTDIKMGDTLLLWDFCVCNDNLAVAICDMEYESLGEDSYEVYGYKYGLVKLSDLYAGSNAYTPVTMCSDGMNY